MFLDSVKFMIERCKYCNKRSIRDEILVENEYRHVTLRRPDRDEIVYCVPNGTPGFERTSIFYRYNISNRMTDRTRQIFHPLRDYKA